MAVRSTQGGFQFGKICSAQQVIHACPHLVAPGGTIGKGLPRSRMIRIADGLSSCVKVCRDHFGKALHLPAAVKSHTQQHGYNGDTGIDPLHPLTSPGTASMAVLFF